MKLHKSILAAMGLLLFGFGMVSCDEDPILPPVNPPVSPLVGEVNTTILDLKTQYWSTDRNYADTIGLTPEGKHVIISGRVISSDSTGNIYKSLVIQDKTAAIAISLDTTKLYNYFPVGEEVIIDMTGQYVGKYNGLFQMGQPEPYQNTYEISFMKYYKFRQAGSPNGLPNVKDIDTLTTTISQIKSWTSQDSIIKYQSRLIRLNDVSFVGGGTLTWADNGSNTNRELRDSQGKTVTVRNSGYASFGRNLMPAGKGDVVCILSYYGTDWQILFRSAMDCFDFSGEADVVDDPSLPDAPKGDGTAESPFSVPQVISGATGSDVWMTGYIVGWVEGASLSDGAHFETPASSASNLLIATTPDETNVSNCVPIQLPVGDVRTALNLQDNPKNLGRQVSLFGNLEKYFSAPGMKSVTSYTWGDKGGDMPAEDPVEDATFKKVTKLTSGKDYIIVANGKVAKPLGSSYGYLQVDSTSITIKDDQITCARTMAFTFKAAGDNWTIQAPDGKYVIMTGTYNSFNMEDSAVEGAEWTVTPLTGGAFRIKNASTGKSIQYDPTYKSYGSYSDDRGVMPDLYEKMN
ncbi:MAG: DUF5689 domain-containing protein [Clostridium sp.]|nr:DUF5689 domain-containing protein [Clostridium sp.]